MKKLLIVLFVIAMLICLRQRPYEKEVVHREIERLNKTKQAQVKPPIALHKKSYKEAIAAYRHLTIEEIDYAVHRAMNGPSHIPVPPALMAAYKHRHAQKYEQEMREIKRLSRLSNEEFLRQVK